MKMICLQPAWISTTPPRRFLAEHYRSQSLGSLEPLKIADAELKRSIPQVSADQTTEFDTTKVYHLLHLRKTTMFCSCDSRKSKKLNIFKSTCCTSSTTDISSKMLFADEHKSKTVNDVTLSSNFFNTSSTKEQKIKLFLKWIQKNGQKASDRYRTLKSSSLYKKQETVNQKNCKTLHDVLSVKETTKAFREFLLKEMSAENLDFWVQVESYKQQKPAKQEKMAKAIFETYIAPGAPKEVNLDCSMRKSTKEKLLSPDSTSFDLPQAQIFKLMENDSFRRFTKLMC